MYAKRCSIHAGNKSTIDNFTCSIMFNTSDLGTWKWHPTSTAPHISSTFHTRQLQNFTNINRRWVVYFQSWVIIPNTRGKCSWTDNLLESTDTACRHVVLIQFHLCHSTGRSRLTFILWLQPVACHCLIVHWLWLRSHCQPYTSQSHLAIKQQRHRQHTLIIYILQTTSQLATTRDVWTANTWQSLYSSRFPGLLENKVYTDETLTLMAHCILPPGELRCAVECYIRRRQMTTADARQAKQYWSPYAMCRRANNKLNSIKTEVNL